MEKVMMVNGSPRAPKSNSRHYAEIFARYCPAECDYFVLSRNNHEDLCRRMKDYTDVLFVFPLYADALPVGFLGFLKFLEKNPPCKKPVVSLLINCGFLEYQQSDVAVSMMKLFCRQCDYEMGSILMLGSGEAILRTPFKPWAVWSIRKLARSVGNGNYRLFQMTMPLSKRLFLMASTYYWTRYGRKFGVTKQQMQTMQIE